jgi:hypothetical protein
MMRSFIRDHGSPSLVIAITGSTGFGIETCASDFLFIKPGTYVIKADFPGDASDLPSKAKVPRLVVE